jgi:hypothetical protein
MLKAGSGLGLLDETFFCLGIAGELHRKELQRYGSLEAGIFGLVDGPHPPAAEEIEYGVVRYNFADHIVSNMTR